jgi:hypothetical protein
LSSFQQWQPAIGYLLGIVTVLIAGFVSFRFSRQRDEYLRQNEINSIASALYAEVITLRVYAAKMANLVAKRYEENGLGKHRGESFDVHFLEMVPMPAAPVYGGLAAQIGKLPATILLGVVQFHAAYEEARYWLPRLQEKEERGFSYSILWVLEPALRAVEGIQPTLETIEALVGISPPIGLPELKQAKGTAEWEREQWAEIRDQQGS